MLVNINPNNLTKLIILSLLLIFQLQAFAQLQESNDNLLQSKNEAQIGDNVEFDYELLNKYVDLALENHASTKIGELKTKVTKQDIELAKYAWVKDITGQFNLNQINAADWGLAPQRAGATSNAFFPLYGFTLRFSVGTFLLTPMEVRKANKIHEIALEEKKAQNATLVNEVVKSYQNYILRKKALFLKLEIETKYHSLYGYVSKPQTTKELNVLEKEAQIYNAYLQALDARNTAEAELRLAKYDLESLIGVKMETVK